MTDVNLAADHQSKTKAKSIYDNGRFVALLGYDPKAAAQYCIDCNLDTEIYGIPVKEYVKWLPKATEDKIETPIEEEIESETDEVEEKEETVEITKEDLQELLKANNIKYHHAAWVKKLTELANDNNLL